MKGATPPAPGLKTPMLNVLHGLGVVLTNLGNLLKNDALTVADQVNPRDEVVR